MATEVLEALKERLAEEFRGLRSTPRGLEASVEARYGELPLLVEHDPEAESIRVSVRVVAPAGAGIEFLLWCLYTNTQYWDVKIGLDDDGALLVHADLDAGDTEDLDTLAETVEERAQTVVDLVDEDLVEWLLEHELGTPAQRQRWMGQAPEDDEEDLEDE